MKRTAKQNKSLISFNTPTGKKIVHNPSCNCKLTDTPKDEKVIKNMYLSRGCYLQIVEFVDMFGKRQYRVQTTNMMNKAEVYAVKDSKTSAESMFHREYKKLTGWGA